MVLYGDVGWWRGHGMEKHGKVTKSSGIVRLSIGSVYFRRVTSGYSAASVVFVKSSYVLKRYGSVTRCSVLLRLCKGEVR